MAKVHRTTFATGSEAPGHTMTPPVPNLEISGVHPARDNIVLRDLGDGYAQSKGGIALSMKKLAKMGRVLYCGPGAFVHETGNYLPLSAEPGDLVLFDRLAGHDIVVDGEMLLVVNNESIVAVLLEKDKSERNQHRKHEKFCAYPHENGKCPHEGVTGGPVEVKR